MRPIIIAPGLLREMMPHAGKRADTFAEHLNAAMLDWKINTNRRVAAFLAQVAHESGSLAFTLELASGKDYEGRSDLGNTHPGDGVRFKGRGLIQVTGRLNYERCSGALGVNFVQYPELLEKPRDASRSAAWFWAAEGLNELADKDKFGTITRRIVGAYSHLDERLGHWLRIREILGVKPL
jgi:putative chitinase